MRVVFDTNVILDVLLDREPHATVGASLCAEVERGALQGYLCATTVTTVHYLMQKALGAEPARHKLRALLRLFDVAPVTRTVLEAAVGSRGGDFEDAVMAEAALQVGATGIVTRDPTGFKGSRIPIYTPQELWKALQAPRP